ncbi:[histone H3]-lysine(4) N-trimethyltransferase [Trifolium repens]|nr:[histone H3]-lysine(4) N-trimethyltransferase [Trifolium repens]
MEESLLLSSRSTLQYNDIDQVQYLDDLIPFHNLTKLELISLDYSWQFLIKILNHCPKLQELNIDQAHLNMETWTRKDDKENWSLLCSIIEEHIWTGISLLLSMSPILDGWLKLLDFHNVHSLRLQINQELYGNDLIPTFHNLTYLKLVCLDYGWQFLIKILNHCPKLQELKIDQAPISKKTWTKKDDKENWWKNEIYVWRVPSSNKKFEQIIVSRSVERNR